MTKYHHHRGLLLVLLFPLLLIINFIGSSSSSSATAEVLHDDAILQLLLEKVGNNVKLSNVKCRSGWTNNGSSSSSSTSQIQMMPIPESWMNDGYCDCPYDGNDEPNTNACSGSQSWPGIDNNNNKAGTPTPETETETDNNNNNKVIDVRYVCPQQPNLNTIITNE